MTSSASPVLRTRLRFPFLTETQTMLVVFIMSFIVLAACIPRITTRLDPVTGDEPFYLMTAYSMLHDQDIDETNNFADRDWLHFYPSYPLPANWTGWPDISPDLPPHASLTYRTGLYSKHGLGIPVLIVLPFALDGRTAVVLLYNLMAAGVAANMYLLARTVTTRRRALILTAILMASLPLVTYAFLIFPEMPAALMLTYTVRRLLASTNTRWQWLLVGLGVGYMPWLHGRFLPVVAGLILVFVWRHLRAMRREFLWAIIPAAALGLFFEAYSIVFYHYPIPNRYDHAGWSSGLGILNGFVGSLLDAQWGLFIVTPLYILSAAALILFLRARWRYGAALLLVLVPYAFTISAYRVWWGEWGPAARYWTAALPMLVLPLAWWWEEAARVRPRAAVILLGCVSAWGFVWTVGWLRQPQWLYNHPDGTNNLLAHWLGNFGLRIAEILPAYEFHAESPVSLRVVWGLAMILIVVAAVREMAPQSISDNNVPYPRSATAAPLPEVAWREEEESAERVAFLKKQ